MENTEDVKMERVETQVLREGAITEQEYEVLFGKNVDNPCLNRSDLSKKKTRKKRK